MSGYTTAELERILASDKRLQQVNANLNAELIRLVAELDRARRELVTMKESLDHRRSLLTSPS